MLDNKIIKIDEDLLTIPIYLNTKIVFDMVATIENGFAEVTNIQTTSGSSKENQIMANIGTENTFSLFNIGLRAERADANNQNRIETEERTHTPVSLYQHLKYLLEQNELIKSEDAELKVGDFVELNGTLRLNPIIDLLSNMQVLFGVYKNVDDNSNNKKGNNPRNYLSNNKTDALLNSLINAFKTEGNVDVICKTKNMDIILQTDTDYFLKKNINEIIDGEFKVLGKIIRICCEKDESISLLRNTSFSLFKQEKLSSILKFADSDNSLNEDKINMKIEIASPTMLVVPIAIYV